MKTEDKALFDRLTPLQLLALTIFGEAEGERLAGKLAVGFVIRNRAGLWRKTSEEICLQENQFECFNTGNARLPILIRLAENFEGSAAVLKDSIAAAQGVLAGTMLSNVGRATFYKTLSCKSPWFDKAVSAGTLVKVAEVGAHEFFEETRFKEA